MRLGRKLMVWEESSVYAYELEYLNETLGYTEQDKQVMLADALDWAWEDFTASLTEFITKRNEEGFWKVYVKGFGWRKLSGYKYLQACTGDELLKGILPKTECSFEVYRYGKGLAIFNQHHDSPCGEWYFVNPIKESTYFRYNS